jgi:hypothetical protein
MRPLNNSPQGVWSEWRGCGPAGLCPPEAYVFLSFGSGQRIYVKAQRDTLFELPLVLPVQDIIQFRLAQ